MMKRCNLCIKVVSKLYHRGDVIEDLLRAHREGMSAGAMQA